MQFSAMVTRCESRFRDESNNIVSADEWKAYLNDAMSDVVAFSPHWPFRKTVNTSAVTVDAATRSKALPTDIYRVTAVRNATDNIDMWSVEGNTTHIRYDPEQNLTGPPRWYRVTGATIEVWPLPEVNTVLHLEYMDSPDELSADGDVPPWPAHYHRILVYGALAKAYEDDGAWEAASFYKGEFATMLDGLYQEMIGQPLHDRQPVIVDDWFTSW